jgi:hypothetical protein
MKAPSNLPPGVSVKDVEDWQEPPRREWLKTFVRYSAADCFRDAAAWLDKKENQGHVVEYVRYTDNGNNPVLELEGRYL